MPKVVVNERDDQSYEVTVHDSAVFSNWIMFRKQLLDLKDAKLIVLDMSNTRFVDHTVMEKLHELEQDFRAGGRELIVEGLEDHRPLSAHPLAARKKTLARA
jgi:MFS superfamily sulfate permease-like transporter